MSLWHLEWLRLWRTRRLPVLAAVFVVSGLAGPLTTRYLATLMRFAGTQFTVVVPRPTPADGIAAYVHNAGQLGLLVVIVVAAGCLTLDADPGRAAFYRTRVSRPGRLIWPRYLVVSAATLLCFLLGTATAWYETFMLLGPLPAGRMLEGAALQSLYLLFVTAAVALAASLARGALATTGIALSAVIALPLLGVWQPLHRWLPSSLADGLSSPPAAPLPAVLTTAALAVVFLAVATHRLSRREL